MAVPGARLHAVLRPGPAGRARATPPVVLIHSLGTDHRIWDAVADHLAARTAVLAYDLRGHGLSDVDPDARLDVHAADALAAIDRLGAPRAVLCGISVGGQIAMAAALAAPGRVAALAVLDSGARIGRPERYRARAERVRAQGLAAIADEQVGRWFSDRSRAAMPDHVALLRNMLLRQPQEGYLAGTATVAEADLGARPAAIGCPTLCLVGAEDVSTPPGDMAELAASIPAAELAVIEGAGHLPPIEAPEATAAALERLLDRAG
jgi:3-oxoadipate enol-lactonase